MVGALDKVWRADRHTNTFNVLLIESPVNWGIKLGTRATKGFIMRLGMLSPHTPEFGQVKT